MAENRKERNKAMKVVFISGGSRGIGAALVKGFAAQGYRVAFLYHKGKECAAEVAASRICLVFFSD